MARQRKHEERILGPYEDRRGWRIVHVSRGGEKASQLFETEKDALRAVRALRRELGQTASQTLGEAIDAYELHMRDDKGNKPVSVTETTRRLRRFFPQPDVLLASVDEKRASAYYEAMTRWTKKDGQAISVDYHRNTLAEARSFLKWCVVKKKWLDRNPFEGVEGVGRRKHGKPQLRIDEARRWLDAAVHFAEQDEAGAIAAMLTLLLGLLRRS
jgi:hypothetical protein